MPARISGSGERSIPENTNLSHWREFAFKYLGCNINRCCRANIRYV